MDFTIQGVAAIDPLCAQKDNSVDQLETYRSVTDQRKTQMPFDTQVFSFIVHQSFMEK